MQTRLCMAFPYNTKDQEVFEKICKILTAALDIHKPLHTSPRKPVLVVNRDSIRRGSLDKFIADAISMGYEDPHNTWDIIKVHAVDTCQMWLAGFGKVLDDSQVLYEGPNGPYGPDEAILQLPGDLKDIHQDFDDFISKLDDMVLKLSRADFVIGDFDIMAEGAKGLIDTHGTFPLLYTFFPAVGHILRQKKIKRPRSEFFAVTTNFLDVWLQRRKFAYEQTLAFLIYALTSPDYGNPRFGTWRVERVDVGMVGDYGEMRGFREATDQLERTERMLRMLWRELHGGEDFNVEEFEQLDRRSTAIREAALLTFRNMLAPRQLNVRALTAGRE